MIQNNDVKNNAKTGEENQINDSQGFKVTLDSNIMEVVEKIPRAAEIFAEYGLPCAGCAAASYERISDIIGEFGVDGEEFVKAINNSVESE